MDEAQGLVQAYQAHLPTVEAEAERLIHSKQAQDILKKCLAMVASSTGLPPLTRPTTPHGPQHGRHSTPPPPPPGVHAPLCPSNRHG